MVVECSIRELVRDRLPEAIRGDFFKSIFLGAVVEQVALRIMTDIRFPYLLKMRFYFEIF